MKLVVLGGGPAGAAAALRARELSATARELSKKLGGH